jgi:class III poly(R)-hydroxyalkanoic acid synthase PhaE subunit
MTNPQESLYEFLFRAIPGLWGALMPSASPNPLLTGMGRTYGALADAFGLGSTRELNEAWSEVMKAAVARQIAQAEYLAIVNEAWRKGTERFLLRLTGMRGRGERVESLLELVRQWAKDVDGTMHAAMQSEQGLRATVQVLRAATRHRQQLQAAVGLVSEALHMPTRADLDEAYREIQELKREVRRLKKSKRPATQSGKAKEAIA